MREIGIWDNGRGVDKAFNEIVSLSEFCRFKDCSHTNEPGCKVIEAINNGQITSERYDSYLKLKKEAAYIERKSQSRLKLEQKKKMKDFGKQLKQWNKVKY